jgi:hypothetical protein
MSGNACVALYYSFNDSENRWVLLEKDSLVFTRPQTDYDISNDFGHFVAHYAFNPDSTAASGWNCNFYQIKIDSECTANKLVIRGYDQYFNFHYKHIYIFSSPDWKRGNLQESGQQCITLNENCINSKTLRFKDSLGNDTLIIDYVHDNIQTDWNLRETSYCKRSYDSFGNEISVINATFGADTQLNQRETKIIKTYALINNVPANERCVFPATRFSIKRFNGSLQFSAAGINEVTIYNLAGNPVAHDIQKSASKATSLTISCSKIVPGFYMAEVVTGGKKSRCTVTILR